MSEGPNSEQKKSASSSLQGREPALADERSLHEAVEQAFDYRGDVTIETTAGRTLAGYVFDRRTDREVADLRMMLPDGERVTLRYDEIARLIFTGRDTAAGKSWETWVRKYVEKKTRGEAANIDPEPLE